MLTDPAFWAVAIPAVLIAGIAKGGFSGGVVFVAVPTMALVIGPANAAAIMLPLLIIMDAMALKAYWGQWSRPDARLLVLGAVPGIAIGAMLFGFVDEQMLKLALGLMALGFVAFMLARNRGWVAARKSGDLSAPRATFWGALGGFTSFVAHAGGPPTSIHLLSRPLGKTEYQATSVIVFAVINLLKLPCYAVLGLFPAANLTASALLAPVAALGLWLGVIAHRRVPERMFFGIIYVCLVLVGVKLIADGL